MFTRALRMVHAVVLSTGLVATASAAAPAPMLLALDRDGGRLHVLARDDLRILHQVDVGAHPHEVIGTADGGRAWVALYGDAASVGHHLVEVDLVAGSVLRRVDTMPLLRPHGLVRAGVNLYFTAEMNRAVARLDTALGRVDRVLGIGRDASHMLAIAPDGQQLFTTDLLSGSVSRLDFRAAAPLPKLTHVAVGDRPEGLAVSPDGRELWVGLTGEARMRVVDLASESVHDAIPAGSYPARVRFSRDGRRVYTSDPQASALLVFDAASRTRVATHHVAGVPLGIQPADAAGRVYLSLVQAGAVIEFDAEAGRELRRIELGRVSDGLALAGEGV